MPNNNALFDPTVLLNNETLAIVPGSFSFDPGIGEGKVLPQSEGNGKVSSVYTEDTETKKSVVKFKCRVTKSNYDLLIAAKANKNANGLVVTEADFMLVFNNMGMVGRPDITISSEGAIEFHFEGDPAK